MSLKPRRGRSWKRLRRIEIAAELEARFIPDAEIAAHLGITVAAVQVIKNTPEYLAKRTQLSTGILSSYQQTLLSSDEAKKEAISDLLPTALTAVRALLQDRSHPHHAKVVLDILDRNKATSKISRTEHSLAVAHDTSEQNKRAQELLALLGDTTPTEPEDLPEPQIIDLSLELEPELEIADGGSD